ncbi:MAG: hypothetical protein MJ099_03395 [Clostridia bacterium]|nr:hypothetical protein [Clostridia bacterium]
MLIKTVAIIIAIIGGIIGSAVPLNAFRDGRFRLSAFTLWFKENNAEQFIRKNVVTGVVTAAAAAYLPIVLSLFIAVEEKRSSIAGWVAIVGFLIVVLILNRRELGRFTRPTARLVRLYLLQTILITLVVLLFSAVLGLPPYLSYAVVPYLTLPVAYVLDPLETKINASYQEEARKKRRQFKHLAVIGIAGTAGKTHTKFILRAILARKYNVLATPSSYNTAIGIAKTIMEALTDQRRVFIVEMGTQHKGEIRDIVRLTRPSYGAITTIGDENVDLFGSMSNVSDAVNELIDGLPEKGKAFFVSDNAYADRLAAKCTRDKTIVGVDNADCDVRISKIDMDEKGMRFDLMFPNGDLVRCRTRLLGELNAKNIALSAAIAFKLGMTSAEIAEAIAKLPVFEKQLQLKKAERFEIDDTRNRSLKGVSEAFNVLSHMPGRHVVVTAGFSSDDKKVDELNYDFGVMCFTVVDIVILIGDKDRLRSMRKGIQSIGFPQNSMHIVETLADAEDMLEQLTDEGDTILYELPMDDVE